MFSVILRPSYYLYNIRIYPLGLLRMSYDALRRAVTQSALLLRENAVREAEGRRSRAQVNEQKRVEEEARAAEEAAMEANDPIARLARAQHSLGNPGQQPIPSSLPEDVVGENGDVNGVVTPNSFGPHLKRVSALEATARVHRRFGSNNQPVVDTSSSTTGTTNSTGDGKGGGGGSSPGGARVGELERRLAAMPYNVQPEDMQDIQQHPSLDEFPDAAAFLAYAEQLQRTLVHNMAVITELVKRKDIHYGRIKEEMLSQALERRQREEEVSL